MDIIFLCSGVGERCKPLTDKVHKSMIETRPKRPNVLNSYLEICKSKVEIDKVIIVGSQKFIDDYNKGYDFADEVILNDDTSKNNFLSMQMALERSTSDWILVVEGDIVIKEGFRKLLEDDEDVPRSPKLFCKNRTNEWEVKFDKYGNVYFNKGGSGLCLNGVSLINRCIKYSILDHKYKNDDFWDVALEHHFDLNVVDSSEYLDEYDSIKDLINNDLMKPEDIARALSDDGVVKQLDSMTNTNYLIMYNGVEAVLRLPGYHTEDFVDRRDEALITQRLCEAGVTVPSVVYNDGTKISEYTECRKSDFSDKFDVVRLLKKVHQVSTEGIHKIDLLKEIDDYEKLYSHEYDDYKTCEVTKYYRDIISRYQDEDLVLCQRDLDVRNILVGEYSTYLTDFEYSGVLNKYWDLGCHISELELYYHSRMDSFNYLKDYSEDVDLYKVTLWSGIVDFIWSCWSISEICLGHDDYMDYFKERWSRACTVMKGHYENLIGQ